MRLEEIERTEKLKRKKMRAGRLRVFSVYFLMAYLLCFVALVVLYIGVGLEVSFIQPYEDTLSFTILIFGMIGLVILLVLDSLADKKPMADESITLAPEDESCLLL